VTSAELALQFLQPLAAVIVPVYASHVVAGWSFLQYIVCNALAFATVGGTITEKRRMACVQYRDVFFLLPFSLHIPP